MAVIEGGLSGTLAEVGAGAAKGLHTINKPHDIGSLGAYRVAAVTGTIAAGLGAGSATVGHMFALRNSHASNLMVINYIRARFQTLTAFTAATVTDFGFDLFRCTANSVNYTTNKANPTPSKLRTSFGTSGVAATDLAIATTVGMTGQTSTQDTSAIGMSIGDPNIVNAAAATEYANQGLPPELLYLPNVAHGEYPLVLANNEGIVIRNRAAWAAAGTGLLVVECGWSEVTAY